MFERGPIFGPLTLGARLSDLLALLELGQCSAPVWQLVPVRRELNREDIPNRFKAFHNLCRTCHHEVNENQNRRAPYECDGCHQ